MEDTAPTLHTLLDIVRRLRGPQGCPWDRRQTALTLKPYLLEEAYELADALDGPPGHVREELGDLLFHIVFFNQIFEELGHFSLREVIADICTKMIRRHPHVFGDLQAGTEEELRERWRRIKAEEEPGKATFHSIPRSLPALRRAHKVTRRAAGAGFGWPAPERAWEGLEKKIDRLKAAMESGSCEHTGVELGEVLLALVDLGRICGVDAEEALTGSTNRFIERFERLEKAAGETGKTVAELSPEELAGHWARAKKN